MKPDKTKFWLFLPAVTAGGIIDVINNIGDIILQVLALLFGTTGAPIQEVIFIYLLPFLLIYFTLYDFIYLMGFFRKRTAQILAVIFALFGARLGVYKQVVDMMGVLLGTGTTGTGLWIPMLTFVFVIMAFWWVVGQFLWGYKFAVAIDKEVKTVNAAIGALDQIGTHMEKLSQKKGE
jgi:hypothetical protein